MPRYALSLITAVALIFANCGAHASGGFLFSEEDEIEFVAPKPKTTTPKRQPNLTNSDFLTSNGSQPSKSIVNIKGPGYDFTGTITTNQNSYTAKLSEGMHGHYVIIASARDNSAIKVGVIESATNCTNIRPRFGLTKTSEGGFSTGAYAVYYGPYTTRQEALSFREKVEPCVGNAFVHAGVIQRH
jgi:hypothetical protein